MSFSKASSIFDWSWPPAWAKSFLPPPPLPPIISDPILTNLTASYLLVKLSVIPTAIPTFSSLLAKTTTIPSDKSFLPWSTNFLNSLGGRSSTFWSLNLIPLMSWSLIIFLDLSFKIEFTESVSNCFVKFLIKFFWSDWSMLGFPPSLVICWLKSLIAVSYTHLTLPTNGTV